MNTHFGQLNFNPSREDDRWLERITSLFLRDAPEPPSVFSSGPVSILCRNFAPTKIETPMALAHAPSIFWDGRLDNGRELLDELGVNRDVEADDSEIAALAFGRWRTNAFRKLIGDWSFVAWDPTDRSITLAKDPIGTRPLYYEFASNRLRWGTALEWLVEAAHSPLEINFEYVAGWLSSFPAAELTPFESIAAVPPSSFVRFVAGKNQVQRYWEFTPREQIQYLSDGEYDEHFRTLLEQSVRRRLRGPGPMLAELSGGMDSSSIVCMADTIATKTKPEALRLDTVSYFDDSEPSWNERPYFTKVEEKRGRAGAHIALDLAADLDTLFRVEEFASTPAECVRLSPRNRTITELANGHGYVGILSGTGGDEFTGGVPTGQPELADLLVAGRFLAFGTRLKVWALSQKRPCIHLFRETAGSFFPPSWTSTSQVSRLPTWLHSRFVTRYRQALDGYQHRLRVLGPRPSFQENLLALNVIRRQLACSHITSRVKLDKRYPYLDRDLLEFLFAVPRHRLIQPGRRRALMRRALAGIVPDEILMRKRKAFVTTAPRAAINARWDTVALFATEMMAEALGIVSSKALQQVLLDIRSGCDVPVQPVLRTLVFEKWLRIQVGQGLLVLPKQIPIEGAIASTRPQPEMNL